MPAYVCFGEKSGISRRGSFFRDAMNKSWHPHVARRAPLEKALRDLVAEVVRNGFATSRRARGRFAK